MTIPPAVAASVASSALGALASLAPDASQTSAPAERNDVIGQQELLTLLVAQLQSQDPLNPLDSADFSAQLAQFSSLEQLMQINQRLGALVDPGEQPAQLDPVSFLGREVTAVGGTVHLSSGAASPLEYTLAAAGTVTVEVRDANGDVVATASLGEVAAGRHELDLASLPGVGPLADGTYEVVLAASGGDGAPLEVETRVRGTVTGVDLSSSPPTLSIGEIQIPLGDVREVRSVASEA
ncbi:MAG: flagellar hook capping FlgD N-terminal domain-containing protein [Thermodesulfobacteriota bacterium]